MQPVGTQLIAGAARAESADGFTTADPRTGSSLDPVFRDATTAEVADAVAAAAAAAAELRTRSPRTHAVVLDALAAALDDHVEVLVDRADAETALGRPRLVGEVARTSDQLRRFAAVVRDGAHLEVVIDHAETDTTPPRPDLRRMLQPLGPVVVFGASNFPFAFGVLGGDTASALAAGCPVVVKPHPSNAGTSELVGRLASSVVADLGWPSGTFSLLQGAGERVGSALVGHPEIAAVGFTGSLRGGRALYDLAAARPSPIPVYAEMGSTNPVFVTPAALATRGTAIAEGFVASATLGAGQFCTQPGVLFLPARPDTAATVARIEQLLAGTSMTPLLDERLARAFGTTAARLAELDGVDAVLGPGPDGPGWQGRPTVLTCDLDTWRRHASLREECFGPLSVVVTVPPAQLVDAARTVTGSLTATIHRHPDDDDLTRQLADVLVPQVGRLLYDGFPTGVAVSWAMQHGGPYPATTAPLFTSVGATAVRRFLRPVAYQDAPTTLLPEPLRDDATWPAHRRVDGRLLGADPTG